MKNAFTVMELLVVVGLIGIILGLIVPNTLSAINEANAKESASNIGVIDAAIQLCFASTQDWGMCDDITGELVENHYLERPPDDPFDIGYTIGKDPEGKGVRVRWEDHFTQWPPDGFIDHVKSVKSIHNVP